MEDTNKKIDELAEMVKSGFDEVGQRFDDLRSELKADIAGVDNRLSAEISSVRVELKSDIAHVDNKIAQVDNKLSSETSSIRSEISALRSEMHDGFVKTNDKVDLLAERLVDKKVITKADAKKVMSLGPLPLA